MVHLLSGRDPAYARGHIKKILSVPNYIECFRETHCVKKKRKKERNLRRLCEINGKM